ncbi:MAG: hypothetical protein AAGF12_43240, partial [Myxococcota bacterium]
WPEPTTMAESGGERIPAFQVGARGLLGAEAHARRKKKRIHCAKEVTRYRGDHRASLAEWKKGDTDIVFPFGNLRMSAFHHAKAEPAPHDDALLLQPGPTLDDVRAELARQREPVPMDAAHALVNEGAF